jgi:response regulator RpfG family c-di-GMP phosphodiesterase
VAEAFDAMTVRHAYRKAMSSARPCRKLSQFAGTQFNPEAVKALCMGHIRPRDLNAIKPKTRSRR